MLRCKKWQVWYNACSQAVELNEKTVCVFMTAGPVMKRKPADSLLQGIRDDGYTQ